MGAVLSMPIIESSCIVDDLNELKTRWGMELIATVLDEDATGLHEYRRSERIGLLLGGEAQGLEQELQTLCHKRVTIPMTEGTDSLNIAVAAAVFLYGLGR